MDAHQVIERCRLLASYTEETGHITRTFLSEPMRAVYQDLSAWMQQAGMSAIVDHAGNLRASYDSPAPAARRLYIGSHVDTVPRAGAFDGIMGVVLAVALV